MMTGRVKWYSQRKEYGFIIPNDIRPDRKEIFFHAEEFTGDAAELKADRWVTFEAVIETSQGPRAERVQLCAAKKPRPVQEGVKPISEYEGWHGTQ